MMERSDLSRRLLLWGSLAALVAFAVEFMAFGAFRVATGRWFSHSEVSALRQARAEGSLGSSAVGLGTTPGAHALHPYVGYVYDPAANTPDSTAFHRNPITPYGYLDRDPFIHKKSQEQYVVGILGGSVAYWLSVMAQDAIVEALANVGAAEGREVVIVRHALGGFKQPQQLMALTYNLSLGAEYDLIINVDGFNEIALPPAENVPQGVFPHYPRVWYLLAGGVADPQMMAAVGGLQALERQRAGLAQRASASIARFSVLGNFIWRARDHWIGVDILAQQRQIRELRSNTHDFQRRGPDIEYAVDDALFADLARVWANSSLQMANLASSNGASYLHFLQPNQYLPGSKPMGTEERALAFRQDHPYGQSVAKGYPLLRTQGEKLRKQGVGFYDLSMLFAEERAVLYMDDCCHYNELGNQIVGRAIGDAIRRQLAHE
jgi:hypothetical protein